MRGREVSSRRSLFEERPGGAHENALNTISLSIVVPVYRGAEFLEALASQLGTVRLSFERSGAPLELSEVIFVDDASSDGSAEVLERLAAGQPWVKVVTLSRNYGQHPATVAGVLHTSGDWVATLDEDLQHRPQHLETLLARAVAERLDVVYAQAEAGPHRSLFRDLSSRWAKQLVSWLAGNPVIPRFNSFRMIRGSIARAAAAVASRETYFDVALSWFTRRIGSVVLPLHDPRAEARVASGYDLRALLRHGRRMLVSSQIRPLRMGGVIGIASLGISLVGGVTALLVKLVRPELIQVRGWTSLLLAIFFFGGLISLLCGILLEYLSDLHLQSLGRPTFFVVDRSRDRNLHAWFAGRR